MKILIRILVASLITGVIVMISPGFADGEEEGGIVILVNTNAGVSAVDKTILTNIYLGTMTFWKNGKRVKCVMRPHTVAAGNRFFRDVLSMIPQRFRHHWMGLELSGKAMPPKVLPNAADVAEFVVQQDGAIGYILSSELPLIESFRARLNVIRLQE